MNGCLLCTVPKSQGDPKILKRGPKFEQKGDLKLKNFLQRNTPFFKFANYQFNKGSEIRFNLFDKSKYSMDLNQTQY